MVEVNPKMLVLHISLFGRDADANLDHRDNTVTLIGITGAGSPHVFSIASAWRWELVLH
jgi:hypothetical protein